jgi:cysteine desulfurase
MLPWWRFGGAGNPHSHEHAFGWRAAQAIDRARSQLAELIGADEQDLIFTSGATESNNLAILGTMRTRRSLRRTVLVAAIDHASVIGPATMLEDEGFQCVSLPVDAQGRLLRETFLSQLTDDVLLVSVGAANNEVGTLQDLPWIAEQCHAAGAFVHTDAAQALTAAPVSVRDWGVDLGSLSAHKAYGPQGIGALYVAPGLRAWLRAISKGGGQQSALRPGTLPTALCVGFGMAAEILGKQGTVERQLVDGLRDQLIASLLLAFPDASINGPLTNRHPGNVNLRIPGIDATDLIQRLQPNVALSSGSACHSGSDQPSNVLLAMGLSNPEARESVRLGVGRFTTAADIRLAVEMIAAAIRQSRAALQPRTAVSG